MSFSTDIKAVLDSSTLTTSLGTTNLFYQKIPDKFDIVTNDCAVYSYDIETKDQFLGMSTTIYTYKFVIKFISSDEIRLLNMSSAFRNYFNFINASKISFPDFVNEQNTLNIDNEETIIYMNEITYLIKYQ